MEINFCGRCEYYWEGPEEENTDSREPCPECGSTARSISVHIKDKIQLLESIRGKAKDHSLPSRKKIRKEFFYGYERSVALKKYIKKTRVIDKSQDHYHEKVEDPDSGQIIHECTEPLSEHRKHGYAKFKNDDNGKP